MKSKARSIRWQKVREVKTKQSFGERSAYWDWVDTNGFVGADGEIREMVNANPDILRDGEPQSTPDLDTRALMLEAIKRAKLSKREKAVLKCLGIQGLTEEKTAENLGISRRQVRVHFSRAQKKCEKIFVAILGDSSHIGR